MGFEQKGGDDGRLPLIPLSFEVNDERIPCHEQSADVDDFCSDGRRHCRQLLCAVSPRAQSREIDSLRRTLLPAGPIVEFARTGNDEADAAQVRSNFLAKVNPGMGVL